MYKVEVREMKVIVTNPQGEMVEGFVTESGNWGAKNKRDYLAMKVANRQVNIKEAIKEANK